MYFSLFFLWTLKDIYKSFLLHSLLLNYSYYIFENNFFLQNKSKERITVWGTGDQQRDFIHIEDCVAGVTSTMDKVNDGSAINLSTGKLTSFKEFVKITSNILGFEPFIEGTSNKPEGVFARGGDTQLQNQLGFKSKITFTNGIEEALNYFDT